MSNNEHEGGIVLRYGIPAKHRVHIGSKIVHFGYQPERNAFSIWMLAPLVSIGLTSRSFDVVSTGEAFEGTYRATAIMPDDFHVFHLIETTEAWAPEVDIDEA